VGGLDDLSWHFGIGGRDRLTARSVTHPTYSRSASNNASARNRVLRAPLPLAKSESVDFRSPLTSRVAHPFSSRERPTWPRIPRNRETRLVTLCLERNNMHRNHLGSPRRRSSALLGLIASVMIGTGALADATLDVESSAASGAVGIKGFEVSDESTAEGSVWFCQVVGSRKNSGSITVQTDGSRTTAKIVPAAGGSAIEIGVWGMGNLEVKRDGVVIASVTPGPTAPGEKIPIGGSWAGLEALRTDAAWGVVLAAASDSKLLDHLRASAPVVAPSCESACRSDWPTPADCNGAWDSYVCCIVEANYDFCRRYCNCDTLGSPGSEACKSAAAALLILEDLKCAAALAL